MGKPISELYNGLLSLQPVDLLAPLSELTRFSPSRRGLLLLGFRRFGHPHRRQIMTTAVTGQVPLAGLSPARTPTSIAATVRWVYPSTAERLAYQTAPSLTSRWLSLHPASSASHQLCVCPSCTPWLHLTFRSVSEQCARWCTAMRGVGSSTPEALATVWVILSQSIIT